MKRLFRSLFKYNLINTGNSVSLFFLLLLIFSVAIVFSFETNRTPSQFSENSMPKIEINNFTAYEITSDSLLSKLTAKNGKQFEVATKSAKGANSAKKESFEELNDITLERKGESFDLLKAKSAKRMGDEIFFDNGVSDLRDGYEMYSEVAHYDLKTRKLTGKEGFFIKSKSEDIKGENIRYDSQNGVIKADNIKAIIKLKSDKR